MSIGGESEYVERKRSAGEHREAVQSIASKLNKHGRGELFFDVDDEGNVVGQQVSDRALRDRGKFRICVTRRGSVFAIGVFLWRQARFRPSRSVRFGGEGACRRGRGCIERVLVARRRRNARLFECACIAG